MSHHDSSALLLAATESANIVPRNCPPFSTESTQSGHRLVKTTDVALFASCRLGRAEIPFFNGSAHAVGKQPCSLKLEKLSGRASSIGARRCVHAA
jgi:hypothetical protein